MALTDIRWLSGAMSSRPLPTPATAVTIGSAMARTEPNATSRMTAAATIPISDAFEAGVSSAPAIALPPSSTARPGARAAVAVAITRPTSARSRSSAAPVKVTVA
ncbi:hypothetical protein [Streptacidiphilus rugosus]|uniref:hypothetical protein n=1 Tax=Streptacidiphilus rugosus TaxID=405783 RepID=UPI001E5B8E75|nr:hypothetical protein [Streptacidiphilus rugosus]